MARQQFCTFYLGSRLLGIEVLKVQEVMKHQQVTEIPLAPAVVRGLLNLRGSIVTTVDLRGCFGMPCAEGEELPTNIVCQTSDGLVSLLVDRIGDVVEVEDTDFEAPPETLQGRARDLIDGVYLLQAGLMSAVNIEHVVDFQKIEA